MLVLCLDFPLNTTCFSTGVCVSTTMSLLYRSQMLNQSWDSYRPSEEERRRRLDNTHMKKFGHPFLKTYEVGDEHRVFLPERVYDTYIVYHRYTWYTGNTTCFAGHCYCYLHGDICTDCRPLNTTSLYDLSVPIDPERFHQMVQMMKHECHMSMIQIYNWFSFWIHDIFPKRYSYTSSTPMFYLFRHFDEIKTPYSFFSFLWTFITKREFTKRYTDFTYDDHKQCFVKTSSTTVRIRTLKSLIRWSLEVYSRDMYITHCQTSFKRKSSVFTVSSECTTYDRYRQYVKTTFDKCVDEINNEVAYRPHKAGMISARDDFNSNLTK